MNVDTAPPQPAPAGALAPVDHPDSAPVAVGAAVLPSRRELRQQRAAAAPATGPSWSDRLAGFLAAAAARLPRRSSPREDPQSTGRRAARVASSRREARRKAPSLRRAILVWAIPALALLVLKGSVLGLYRVPSASMQNTLQPGDRMLVNLLADDAPARGDIVVFDGTGSFDPGTRATGARKALTEITTAVGLDGRRMYVKRVIGLPGDTITCCTADGHLTVNGEPLAEPYLFEDDEAAFGPITVPAGHVWMMGDHRSNSADSRAHLLGPSGGFVPVDAIAGRVIAVTWPLGRTGTIDHPTLSGQLGRSASRSQPS